MRPARCGVVLLNPSGIPICSQGYRVLAVVSGKEVLKVKSSCVVKVKIVETMKVGKVGIIGYFYRITIVLVCISW